MKFWSILGCVFFLIISCQKKEKMPVNIIDEVKEDTLDIPHYPFVDYDAPLKNETHQDFSKQKEFVQHFFDSYWTYNKVSGGLLVAKNGQLLFEGYRGYANAEKKDTLTADTPIHIASISKVLTSLAVLKLIDEKRLSLEDSLSKFFPHFPYKGIRVQELLNHRSGLPNYAYFEHNPEVWDTHKTQSNQSVLDALMTEHAEPYNQPNTHFSYCNTNYVLLALIIEKVTNVPYAEAMRHIVFEPLKMNKTFVLNIQDSAKVSQSYTLKGKRWEFDFLDQIYGDKNIYSTPRDLLKMDKALYHKDFLSVKLKKLMTQGYSYEQKGIKNYGLGIRMMEWDTGEKLLYHNGWWHGNYATYVRGEADTLTIIALGNQRIRSVYSAFSLAGMFGNYPIGIPADEFNQPKDSLKMSEDSIMKPLEVLPIKAKKQNGTIKEIPKANIDSSKNVILSPKNILDSTMVDSIN